MPSANPPRHTTTTITMVPTRGPVPRWTSVSRVSTAPRREVVESAIGGVVVVTHDDRSVPRQTGTVTPDPAAIDEAARDHVIVAGPDGLDIPALTGGPGPARTRGRGTCWTLVLEPTGKVESPRATPGGQTTNSTSTSTPDSVRRSRSGWNRFKNRVAAEIVVEPARSAEPTDGHEAARVAAGWPRMGLDIVPGQTIP